MAPRAARTPLRTAADWPDDVACRIWRRLRALLHEGCKPLGGRIRGAVIDVDDFIGPSAVERGGDFGDQRRYILGFVAHGNNDGNGHRGLGQKKANQHSWFELACGR